jgi:predicted  nucleic acid-binding Zn-ribbon protein
MQVKEQSMSVTSALRECHRLRLHLRNLQAEIDRGPRILQEHQDELDAARREHQAHHDAIKALRLKQRDDEGTLKQTDARLAKLEEQLTGISVQKEYAAKELEIAHAKEKKGELEDAILAAITGLEGKTAAVPAVEEKWKAAQDEFKRAEGEAAERLERLRADLEASRADLAKAEATIPPDAKSTYDQIVRTKGPDAFAAAKNRVCQGCRTSMTEVQFNELRRGAFRTCITCGRMQYPAE